jgi:fatty-acyl-CoA synthase
MAGTHVCLRRTEAKAIYDAIADEGVTHMCGAPIVMGLIANAPADQRRDIPRGVRMMTAGAAPPAAVIERMEGMGFDVTHVYGLTEVYGPAVVCAWHDEWNARPPAERAALKARRASPTWCRRGSWWPIPSRSVRCRWTARRWARSSCAETS